MFFLSYRHADDTIFDDFPKISEDFLRFSKIVPKGRWTFLSIFQTFRNIFRTLPKIAKDDRRGYEDVSIIHQQI